MMPETKDAGARRGAGAHRIALARAIGSRGVPRALGVLGVLGVLLAAGCEGASPAHAATKPQTHRVQIQGFAFQPADLVVAAGDTVVWTNLDFVPHTATDDGGRWSSGSIGPNESWRQVVRAASAYHCALHPNMRGRLSIR